MSRQACIVFQSWCLVAPGLVPEVLLSGMKNASSSSCHLPVVGGLVLQKGSKIFPWGWTRTLPQSCPVVSWLLLPGLSIPSLPWLATVRTCSLELREGLGARSLFPKNKKGRTRKGFAPRSPTGALLGYTTTKFNMDKILLSNLQWIANFDNYPQLSFKSSFFFFLVQSS